MEPEPNFQRYLNQREFFVFLCTALKTVERVLDVHPCRFTTQLDNPVSEVLDPRLSLNDLVSTHFYCPKNRDLCIHFRQTHTGEDGMIQSVTITTPNHPAVTFLDNRNDSPKNNIIDLFIAELSFIKANRA